ncbi:protein FAM163B isoform X1 [Microcebus murinus]|uniref:protein FAM163B isoform X1 n=1 Tax=Microcebus murinus TaxID=30608 RepID=UPI003F6D4751
MFSHTPSEPLVSGLRLLRRSKEAARGSATAPEGGFRAGLGCRRRGPSPARPSAGVRRPHKRDVPVPLDSRGPVQADVGNQTRRSGAVGPPPRGRRHAPATASLSRDSPRGARLQPRSPHTAPSLGAASCVCASGRRLRAGGSLEGAGRAAPLPRRPRASLSGGAPGAAAPIRPLGAWRAMRLRARAAEGPACAARHAQTAADGAARRGARRSSAPGGGGGAGPAAEDGARRAGVPPRSASEGAATPGHRSRY